MADKYIKVRSTQTHGRVLLWRVDKSHPNGEVFISANKAIVEVGKTAEIAALIKSGELEEVTGTSAYTTPTIQTFEPPVTDRPKAKGAP